MTDKYIEINIRANIRVKHSEKIELETALQCYTRDLEGTTFEIFDPNNDDEIGEIEFYPGEIEIHYLETKK